MNRWRRQPTLRSWILPLLLLGWGSAEAAQKVPPPNVVLIFADDLGYRDLGCFGGKPAWTPNLDRLAQTGTRLTDFYVAQAVCSASRTALLTGCYPNRVGIQGALGPNARHGIHADETTVAEMLKGQGYATAMFGKWHLGHHPQFLPVRHGFDEYYGLPYSNDMWPHHPTDKTYPPLPLIEDDKVVETNPDQSRLTTAYTERAVRFIERSKDRPFFLYVPHSMPHVPLFVSQERAGKSGDGLYGDVIREIDWSVGQIVEALERTGVRRRTLVIFTSDNGPWLSYGNHAGSARGFREGKGTSFEGGVRVPAILNWPGVVPAGREVKEPLMTIDILPSLAGITGAKVPKLRIDGRNAWPVMVGESGARSPQEAYYFYWGGELQAVRSGRWKLHFPHTYRSLVGSPGQDGKPNGYAERRIELSLFDLAADPAEAKNVAAEHPNEVARLTQLAEIMRRDLGDSLTKTAPTGQRPPGRLP